MLGCTVGLELQRWKMEDGGTWIPTHKQEDALADGSWDDMESKFENFAIETFEPSAHLKIAWDKNFKSKGENLKLKSKATQLHDACKMDIRHKTQTMKECVDPWPDSGDCKKAYEIPGYRVGDLFFRRYDPRANGAWTKFYFPKSLGARYLAQRLAVPVKGNEDWSAMLAVMDSPEYAKYEHPENDTVVVHFRGYDVMTVFAKDAGQYVRNDKYFKAAAQESVKLGLKKAVIVAGDHWLTQDLGIHSMDNKEKHEAEKKQLKKAADKTQQEMDDIAKIFSEAGLKVSTRLNFNADCDLIFMANSHTFLATGGGYDKLISGLVQRKNGTLLLDHSKSR